jgi:hypothetical protein
MAENGNIFNALGLKLTSVRFQFNINSIKTKGLTLLIEHSPCCLLAFAAGFLGLPLLNHNPAIELGFAVAGAFIGEYIGHNYLFKKSCQSHSHDEGLKGRMKRYGLALAFGLASWGLHQAFLHEPADHAGHAHAPAAQHQAAPPSAHGHHAAPAAAKIYLPRP